MDKNNKKDLSKLTMKDINDLTSEFYDSKQIYSANFQQLSKLFLYKVLPINVWENDFDKIRIAYIEHSNSKDKEIPNDEEEFYKYIFEIYFQLKQEPKQKLLEIFITISEHLLELDERILSINEEIETIKQSNNQKNIQEKVPVLSYYSILNKEARNELLEFIKKGVYDYVILECRANKGIGLWNTSQYEYAFWGSKHYCVSYPNRISNKFMDLTHDEKQEMERLFENDSTAFQKSLKDYIEDKEIIENIRLFYDKNHIVSKKKEMLEECITAYENGNKIVFGGLSFFIVEGIIHDICFLLGNSENELLGKGLQQKLDILQKKLSYELHYEYYSFEFRILRNKMAHGITESRELEETADFLLLDILDVITIATSERIPMNQKRFFIDRALSETSLNRYNYIFGYLYLIKTDIPKFYNIDNSIFKLHKIIQSDSFWAFLDNYVNSSISYDKSLADSILKILKNSNIEGIKQKCVDRIKKYSVKELIFFDTNRFINSLIGH